MLNLVYVETFVTVVDKGSFRGAANALNIAQPTVTQHIKKLEAVLHKSLIKRSHSKCTATPNGQVFLPFARSLLRIAKRAGAALEGRSLAIGASSNVGIYILPTYVKSFTDSLDDQVAIDMQIGTNTDVANKLVDSEIDLAVMEWWDSRPGFTANIWRHEPQVVIVPPDHPWAALDSVPKEWLLQTPMIGGERGTGTRHLLEKVFGDAVNDMKISMQLGSTEAVKRAVKSGLGISITMASAVDDEARAGQLCALPIEDTTLDKDLYVIVPADSPENSPTQVFAQRLLDANGFHAQR